MARLDGPLYLPSAAIQGVGTLVGGKDGEYALVAVDMQVLSELFAVLTDGEIDHSKVKPVLLVAEEKARRMSEDEVVMMQNISTKDIGMLLKISRLEPDYRFELERTLTALLRLQDRKGQAAKRRG